MKSEPPPPKVHGQGHMKKILTLSHTLGGPKVIDIETGM